MIIPVTHLQSFSALADTGLTFSQAVGVGPVETRLQVPGAQPSIPGEAPVPLALSLHSRGVAVPAALTFDQAIDPRWQDVLSEPGGASIVLANDDPDLAQIDSNSLIMFELYGWACFTMLPRQLETTTVGASEESGALTTVSGPGTLAVLEEALVYPSRGPGVWPIEEDRRFSWQSVDYDDTWWTSAWELARWDDPTFWTTDAQGGSPPAPDDWPDPDCTWIWVPGTTWRVAPGGWCPFRSTFEVPPGVPAVRVFFAADATGTVYVDGQDFGTNEWQLESWRSTQVEVPVTAGTHTIAVECANDYIGPGDSVDHNPGGVLVSVYPAGPAGITGPPLKRSDASWRCLSYPVEPPGMTPGEAMLNCLAEAQRRGALGAVVPMFDRFTDSAGAPWPIHGDIATKVGYDLLTFFRELAGTYVDLAMAPGALELYAWVYGTRGEYAGVTLQLPLDRDPSTGNLGQLDHKRTL